MNDLTAYDDPFNPQVYGAPVIAGSLAAMQLSALLLYHAIKEWEKERNAMWYRELPVEFDERVAESIVDTVVEPRKKVILDMMPEGTKQEKEEKDELAELLRRFIAGLKNVGQFTLERDRAAERALEQDITSLGGYESLGVTKQQIDGLLQDMRDTTWKAHGGIPEPIVELLDIAQKYLPPGISRSMVETWAETMWKTGVTPTDLQNMLDQVSSEDLSKFRDILAKYMPSPSSTTPQPRPFLPSRLTEEEREKYHYDMAKDIHAQKEARGIPSEIAASNAQNVTKSKFPPEYFIRNNIPDPRLHMILNNTNRTIRINEESARLKVEDLIAPVRAQITGNPVVANIDANGWTRQGKGVWKAPTPMPPQ